MNSSTKTDHQIIQLLHKKDKQSILYIYDKYGSTLYGVILKTVQSEELAKELLKKTMIKIWEQSNDYDASKAKLFTWLLRISRNLSLSAMQSKKNQQPNTSLALGNFVYSNNKVDNLINVNDHGIKNKINKLDKKYQEIINLIYLQGYNLNEVSEILNLSLDIVKIRIRRATKELRKALNSS